MKPPILTLQGILAWIGTNPDLSDEAREQILAIALADTEKRREQ